MFVDPRKTSSVARAVLTAHVANVDCEATSRAGPRPSNNGIRIDMADVSKRLIQPPLQSSQTPRTCTSNANCLQTFCSRPVKSNVYVVGPDGLDGRRPIHAGSRCSFVIGPLPPQNAHVFAIVVSAFLKSQQPSYLVSTKKTLKLQKGSRLTAPAIYFFCGDLRFPHPPFKNQFPNTIAPAQGKPLALGRARGKRVVEVLRLLRARLWSCSW